MSLSRFLATALLLATLASTSKMLAQTENASVAGRVTDSSGAVVAKTEVQLQNVERGTAEQTLTNDNGLYVFQSVQPGQYRLIVRKDGFRQVDYVGLIVNVQDHVDANFKLQVGSVSESVTVTGAAPLVNTQDGSVSTVVDRNFAENLPMNGRSFQTLINLTPGVVLTATNGVDQGQFSVNGQRASSNYWMVDGVSANIGVTGLGSPGNGAGGAVGSSSALGGTNSLVSVDALQEFRIQTSTFAPEFGRTPGAQISIVTRSGTNSFHGTAFDYFRNDVLDANDWFANNKGLPRAQERQNDFGGTFGGPVLKNRTFFFFSYEGLRLRLPQTVLSDVPDLAARQTAISAIQPFFNAYPVPNGVDLGNGIAEFNASFSNKSSLNAYSLRLDHRLTDKNHIFARYDYSPSSLIQRARVGSAVSELTPSNTLTLTATAGITSSISPMIVNDFRANYSRADADSSFGLDNFGGAVAPSSVPIPSPFGLQNANFVFQIFQIDRGTVDLGRNGGIAQHQINLVDNISFQSHAHSFKVGVDYRRLTPKFTIAQYAQELFFSDVASAAIGNLDSYDIAHSTNPTLLFRNLGLFVQDTWRASPQVTLTYGVRWDTDFSPTTLNGPQLTAAQGFNLNDLSRLALAPSGTPVFKTEYGNVAPRIGVAYQLNARQNWGAVVRAGFGLFYDLATANTGSTFGGPVYPFGTSVFTSGGTVPLSPVQAAPPPIVAPTASQGTLQAYDPNFQLPYSSQWSAALEQVLGGNQSLSMTYIGSLGRRLEQTAFVFSPSPNLASAQLVSNAGSADYHALQVKFERRLTRGLQALASYTWSHSIDTGSAGSFANFSNLAVPALNPESNRGSSDFDVRHAFSTAITYLMPPAKANAFTAALSRDWSIQSTIQVRSALPVDVSDSTVFPAFKGFFADARPDLVPGQPLYQFGSQFPGGRALNPAAFVSAPIDPNSGEPLRQGTVSRNSLRGFGVAQWDFALHREFPLHESIKLQFRAEMFNVLNHPNFGPPVSTFGVVGFGLSNQMFGQSLTGGFAGSGGLSPLYQIGGPRSIQLALKLSF